MKRYRMSFGILHSHLPDTPWYLFNKILWQSVFWTKVYLYFPFILKDKMYSCIIFKLKEQGNGWFLRNLVTPCCHNPCVHFGFSQIISFLKEKFRSSIIFNTSALIVIWYCSSNVYSDKSSRRHYPLYLFENSLNFIHVFCISLIWPQSFFSIFLRFQ